MFICMSVPKYIRYNGIPSIFIILNSKDDFFGFEIFSYFELTEEEEVGNVFRYTRAYKHIRSD